MVRAFDEIACDRYRPSRKNLVEKKLKYSLDANFHPLREFRAKRRAHIGTRWIIATHKEPFSGRPSGNSVLLYGTRHAFKIVIGDKSERSASLVTSRRNA